MDSVVLQNTTPPHYKEYRIDIINQGAQGWTVLARYGKIGTVSQRAVIAEGCSNRSIALTKAEAQMSRKMAKGYEVIEGSLED